MCTVAMQPVGVCPLMRVLQYRPGQEFHAHADGADYAVQPCATPANAKLTPDSRSQYFQSLLTLAIYINDGDNDASEQSVMCEEITTPGEGEGGIDLSSNCNVSDFAGGGLEFVQPPVLVRRDLTQEELQQQADHGNVSSMTRYYAPYTPAVTISPRTGRCVVFHQTEHHQAHPLTSGTKYMIQTSVLFSLPLLGGEA